MLAHKSTSVFLPFPSPATLLVESLPISYNASLLAPVVIQPASEYTFPWQDSDMLSFIHGHSFQIKSILPLIL